MKYKQKLQKMSHCQSHSLRSAWIKIRDKENRKQDLAGLNRDTQNALNKLGEIFDNDQELAGLFSELSYKAVSDLAEKNG